MSIIYPIDILADFPGWTPVFELQWRQELSRSAGGTTFVKDFGSPLWRLTATSVELTPNQMDEWRARLNALENGMQRFKGYPLSRVYPIAYPNGSWPTGAAFNGQTARVNAIGVNNKSFRISSLPAGFQFRVGDKLQVQHGAAPVRYDVYEVQEAAVADGGGITSEFEVRPHLWPGVAVNNLVSVVRPWCLMQIVPGSIQSPTDQKTGRGMISFQAFEARDE